MAACTSSLSPAGGNKHNGKVIKTKQKRTLPDQGPLKNCYRAKSLIWTYVFVVTIWQKQNTILKLLNLYEHVTNSEELNTTVSAYMSAPSAITLKG